MYIVNAIKKLREVLVPWIPVRNRGRDYSKLPQFVKYDLENGFLLDVKEGESIEFIVDAALTRAHSDAPGWTKISIMFPKVTKAHWFSKTIQPTIDRDGSIDYGAIDSFVVCGSRSHLYGGWGEIEIVSDPVQVTEIGPPSAPC